MCLTNFGVNWAREDDASGEAVTMRGCLGTFWCFLSSFALVLHEKTVDNINLMLL